MKQTLRQKLKNYFLLGFILFAATSDKVLQPLINNIQDLERGYELKIGNKTMWVTGGLGVITRDLPEGNEQAGVKNHNTHHGCCNCMIHHSELDNVSFDTARHSRYYHKTILQFSTIRRVQTQAQRDALAMQYGIREKPPVFDSVMRDHHLQCSHDAFHCMGVLPKKCFNQHLKSYPQKERLNF
ncbi:9255_t:CDS:1 [Funneliformis mosseae]|uniref:9255_t:CDS:1 n=1 Tax=Funneliformis mosseae TaxID=27381 RepID=A0A9N9NEE6_FUNMO|nr:9255_t:CDS:1 [Funneliformis mosseae]